MVANELTTKEQAEVTRRNSRQEIPGSYTPAADIWETEEAIFIRVDMPGVSKDNVDVKVERDMLHVSGKITGQPSGNVIYAEQRASDYSREFTLSDDLDRDNISAQMDSGVLTIEIAKAEKLKPRKIEITAAQ